MASILDNSLGNTDPSLAGQGMMGQIGQGGSSLMAAIMKLLQSGGVGANGGKSLSPTSSDLLKSMLPQEQKDMYGAAHGWGDFGKVADYLGDKAAARNDSAQAASAAPPLPWQASNPQSMAPVGQDTGSVPTNSQTPMTPTTPDSGAVGAADTRANDNTQGNQQGVVPGDNFGSDSWQSNFSNKNPQSDNGGMMKLGGPKETPQYDTAMDKNVRGKYEFTPPGVGGMKFPEDPLSVADPINVGETKLQQQLEPQRPAPAPASQTLDKQIPDFSVLSKPIDNSWRGVAAPAGLAQLADKLGVQPKDFVSNPKLLASAIGEMEGGSRSDKNSVAEAVMDQFYKYGADAKAVMKVVREYDTMTMAKRTVIGNIARGDTNSTIRNLNPNNLTDIQGHIDAVKAGTAEREIPHGFTMNFSPAAARVQPTRGWTNVTDPNGRTIFVPPWARNSVRNGMYKEKNGEFFVPDSNDKQLANMANWETETKQAGPVTGPQPNALAANKEFNAPVGPDTGAINRPMYNHPMPQEGNPNNGVPRDYPRPEEGMPKVAMKPQGPQETPEEDELRETSSVPPRQAPQRMAQNDMPPGQDYPMSAAPTNRNGISNEDWYKVSRMSPDMARAWLENFYSNQHAMVKTPYGHTETNMLQPPGTPGATAYRPENQKFTYPGGQEGQGFNSSPFGVPHPNIPIPSVVGGQGSFQGPQGQQGQQYPQHVMGNPQDVKSTLLNAEKQLREQPSDDGLTRHVLPPEGIGLSNREQGIEAGQPLLRAPGMNMMAQGKNGEGMAAYDAALSSYKANTATMTANQVAVLQKPVQDALDRGDKAQDMINTVHALEDLERQPASSNILTGPWAERWLEGNKTLQGIFGQSLSGNQKITISDALNKISTFLATQTTHELSSRPAVLEFQKHIGAAPGITMSQQSRRALESYILSRGEYDKAMATRAQWVMQDPNNRLGAWRENAADVAAKNPIAVDLRGTYSHLMPKVFGKDVNESNINEYANKHLDVGDYYVYTKGGKQIIGRRTQ